MNKLCEIFLSAYLLIILSPMVDVILTDGLKRKYDDDNNILDV